MNRCDERYKPMRAFACECMHVHVCVCLTKNRVVPAEATAERGKKKPRAILAVYRPGLAQRSQVVTAHRPMSSLYSYITLVLAMPWLSMLLLYVLTIKLAYRPHHQTRSQRTTTSTRSTYMYSICRTVLTSSSAAASTATVAVVATVVAATAVVAAMPVAAAVTAAPVHSE